MRLDETLRLRLVTSQGKNRLVSYTPLAPGQRSLPRRVSTVPSILVAGEAARIVVQSQRSLSSILLCCAAR